MLALCCCSGGGANKSASAAADAKPGILAADFPDRLCADDHAASSEEEEKTSVAHAGTDSEPSARQPAPVVQGGVATTRRR
jgi:hypothetical protein